ncbi:Bax inhibitor-1 family protein [Mycoplasmopsis caviae]|uniref:Bax inhibitor-1 family protein n=1 Tax=Mycoplasmopsis caviae TaxID=55603 RepID=A0A3P8LI44_9BACT|nr:Bax inhibitor-1 family protein [Mycoplasmopsis caviae]UUD35208.1 Bax inhibitor-1 family protein [Mycoplasmopsis caviae]VDR42002.1 Uncharacterised protein [Mycoplasmopsis caviae]
MKNYEQLNNNDLNIVDNTLVRKNTFLGYTLLWFTFCMVISFTTAFAATYNMVTVVNYFVNHYYSWILGGVLTIALLFIYMFLGPKMHLGISIPIVTIIMMGFGLFALSVPLYYAKYTLDWWKLYLVLFLPAGFMLIMGTLAATNKINLSMLWVPLIVLFVAIITLSIVSWFVFSDWLVSLISGLGVLLMVIYMGIDWLLINKFNKVYSDFINTEETKKEMIRMSLFFGFKLAYDYIYCVLYLIRLFSNFKN